MLGILQVAALPKNARVEIEAVAVIGEINEWLFADSVGGGRRFEEWSFQSLFTFQLLLHRKMNKPYFSWSLFFGVLVKRSHTMPLFSTFVLF